MHLEVAAAAELDAAAEIEAAAPWLLSDQRASFE